jgi:hypothetical protein
MTDQAHERPGPLVELLPATLLIGFALWVLFLTRLFPMPFLAGAVGAIPAALTAKHRAGSWRALFPGEGPESELLIATALGAIPVGAIGYALLAAFGLTVPNRDLSLGWRLFCGLAIGAAAGLACALIVHCMVGGILDLISAARQLRRRVV